MISQERCSASGPSLLFVDVRQGREGGARHERAPDSHRAIDLVKGG